jgi:hypothetical protein
MTKGRVALPRRVVAGQRVREVEGPAVFPFPFSHTLSLAARKAIDDLWVTSAFCLLICTTA